jgi:hypothetical protein
MAILSIVHGSTKTPVDLKDGLSSLGRAEGNDIQISDPSVSSRHCEIERAGDGVHIRDLGSTNGTYVNGQPVSEALITPGQEFRVGNVVLRLEGGPPPNPQVLPVAAPAPPAPPALPTHQCQKCGTRWPLEALKMQKVGTKPMPFCPSCGGLSVPLKQVKGVMKQAVANGTFFGSLPDAFKYPFKKNGLILLICGTVLYLVLDFLSVWWMVRLLAAGYLFAYMQKIIVSTAAGDQDMPPWPDVTELWSDVMEPFWLLFATSFASFGPALLCIIWGHPLPALVWLFLGLLYFPMALLSVAMADSVSGLNPLFVGASILRIPGQYFVAVLFLALIAALRVGGDFLANAISIPLIPTILTGFLGLLFLTIEMRVLGLLYYCNRKRLGWL